MNRHAQEHSDVRPHPLTFITFHNVSYCSEVQSRGSAKAGGYSSLQGGGGEEENSGEKRKEEERKGGKFETSYLQLVSDVSRKTHI